jgi:hypothetical protein
MRAALFFAAAMLARGADLTAYPEFLRPDPFGGIVAPDRVQGAAPLHAVKLEAARGGYVSFHLVINSPEGGAYTLSLDMPAPIEAEVYREWFHFAEPDRRYYPDALVPVALPYRSQVPDPENRIEKQTAQAFWVDFWIPGDTPAGVRRAEARLQAAGGAAKLPIEIRVLATRVPPGDVVTVDHNSYGSSWIDAPFLSDQFFADIHAYHRLFYEHRGIFHQLGYGHAGKVGREFAPALEGSGRKKRVADWAVFDRHYGPLLDGSAFAGTRRGPRPIPYVYLPINPEWPASYLWWGDPGYEAEFVNVVAEMERHFRAQGWTKTVFEVFFNHKKRYKGFDWDGDETRFPSDLPYFSEYKRLLRNALPPQTRVQFRMRADVSWMMERQFHDLAGIVTMWVAGGGEFGWLPDAPGLLKSRGDVVWIYGGTPEVARPSAEMALNPLKAWIFGIDGYVHWLSVAPGEDPWFHFDGGGTVLAYPGRRFGIRSPIPSVRLKLERNCLQDLALLDSLRAARRAESLKAEAARLFNGTTPEQWWTPRPPMMDRPVIEWTNADFEEATKATDERLHRIDAASWDRVHRFVMNLASEGK